MVVSKQEVLETITKMKGGKAISVDCIPDTFVSKAYLEKLLKTDNKIIGIAERLENQGGYRLTQLEYRLTQLEYLQDLIARNISTLLSHWIRKDGMPIAHATAKNFFIYKTKAKPEGNTIDEFRPISATSFMFKLLEIIIKKRIEDYTATGTILRLNDT
jgi:hypothetical protein